MLTALFCTVMAISFVFTYRNEGYVGWFLTNQKQNNVKDFNTTNGVQDSVRSLFDGGIFRPTRLVLTNKK